MKLFFWTWLLASSGLLIALQPMVAKRLLPSLGGSPNVFGACMAFFQVAFLLGYGYAHLGPRWLGVRRHAIVHALAMAAAVALLPIAIARPEATPDHPGLWAVRTLAAAVLIPYVLLAGSSSLAQLWYAETNDDDPYFLYAASNLGTFLGLFAYLGLIEPNLTLTEQERLWSGGFVVATGMVAVAAVLVARRARPIVRGSGQEPASATQAGAATVVRWILLALTPSSLLVSITAHITADLAPMPILWALPLGLYFLSFTATFARRPLPPHTVVKRYLPVAILLLALLWFSEATSPLGVILAIDLVGFTWIALFCHGELAATRPPVEGLTAFYFWIALGGALGGVPTALLAPLAFNFPLELPAMFALAGALRPADSARPTLGGESVSWLAALLIGGGCLATVAAVRWLEFPAGTPYLAAVAVPLLATLFLRRPWPYALALALILGSAIFVPSVHGEIVERRRSFFGVHRVAVDGPFVKLIHGNTVHGLQSTENPAEPLAYYHRGSPVAAIVGGLDKADRLKSVGVVGLGGGALAAYARPGQSWTFFEIDPAVEAIARSRFRYLADCKGEVRVILGDARLSLERSTESFDLIVVDAFGSDSIPTHLLTREALAIYASRLRPGGLIALHLSNRYLDLFPILADTCGNDWSLWRSDPDAWRSSPRDEANGRMSSWWALLARAPADAAGIDRRDWRSVATSGGRPWTDDFINLPAAVRWRELFADDS